MDEAGSFPRANQMNSRRRPKALFILIAFLLLLSVLIFLGTRFLGTGSEEEDEEFSPTPIIEATSTPEPTSEEVTPTPEEEEESDLGREDARVQILNGSGVAGTASSMSAILKSAGWTNISTGNAANFDYEDVEISVTEEAGSGLLQMLEDDLSDDYTIGDTDTDLSSDSYDAVITIGK